MKLASFETIVRALNGAGVRYVVAGGLAGNGHVAQETMVVTVAPATRA